MLAFTRDWDWATGPIQEQKLRSRILLDTERMMGHLSIYLSSTATEYPLVTRHEINGQTVIPFPSMDNRP